MVGNSSVCPLLVYAKRCCYLAKLSLIQLWLPLCYHDHCCTARVANFSLFFACFVGAAPSDGACSPGLFYCGPLSNACIVPGRVCDGYDDCLTDGMSDEEDCSKCCLYVCMESISLFCCLSLPLPPSLSLPLSLSLYLLCFPFFPKLTLCAMKTVLPALGLIPVWRFVTNVMEKWIVWMEVMS